MDSPVPSLYPVSLELWCPTHGLLDEANVMSMRAQLQWSGYEANEHRLTGCTDLCNVLVPEEQHV